MAVTKAIDKAYLLTQLKNFDSVILKNTYNSIFQYSTLPEASADNLGAIYQYTGADTEALKNGRFYKVVAGEGETYKYAEVSAQDAPVYTIAKAETPSSDAYCATYKLQKDGEDVAGSVIDIPKDFFLADATTAKVTAEDKAEGGKFYGNDDFAEGDAYIELDVNVTDGGTSTVKPVYVNVSSLVDTYTEGDGITIADNEISVKADENSAIEVTADGVKVKLDAEGGLALNDNKEIKIDFEAVNIDFATEWNA